MLKKVSLIGAAIIAIGAITTPAQAGNISVDFADYSDTYLSSADGVSFSLAPGYSVNGLGTTPYVNAFGDPNEMANSANLGEYPTSNTLTFTFSTPVTDLSFYFNNYGESFSGRGDTFYDAS